MNKRLLTITDTDLSIRTSTAIIVQVGLIKFVKDEEYPWIDIFVTGGEIDEFIVQEDNEKASTVIDLEDLKIFAINWVFENVNVAKNIKLETAPEVPVQEQLQKVTIKFSNMDSLNSLIEDIKNKLEELKNFQIKVKLQK